MPNIRDLAQGRLANLKKTGGIPAPKPMGQMLSNDARQIKARQMYEEIPEGQVKRGIHGTDDFSRTRGY